MAVIDVLTQHTQHEDVTSDMLTLLVPLRFAGGYAGCGAGLERSCGTVQDSAPDGRVSDLLEHCLWSVLKLVFSVLM